MKKQVSSKRILALMLSIILCLSILPVAQASAATIIDSGTCGDNLTWTLDDQGKLTISGTGEMDSNAFDYDFRIVSVEIKDGVTGIGSQAFYDCIGLTSITIPNSVTNIDELAFARCTGLTSVTIPDSVTDIDERAFSYCTGLTSFTVAAGNANYMVENGILFGKNKETLICYPAGKTETSYVIPNSVTHIGGAFDGCTNLTSITIPGSVTGIGEEAFSDCTGLTSVTIPDSVTSIGKWAFSGCTNLTTITIPDSVTSIGTGAFSSELKKLIIADGSKEITDKMVVRENQLTEVVIPDSVTTIGNYAFFACKGLTSVTIPNSVTTIGNSAFSNCSGLTSVTIPDSVTSIGQGAFSGCSDLTSITISNSVTDLRWLAFSGCTNLTTITIPDSVTSIGQSAFSGCTNLTSITIPSSVTFIDGGAFAICPSLTDVYYTGSKAEWNDIDICEDNNYLTGAYIHYNAVVDDDAMDSGTCGENLTWTLDNKGKLTISGTGAMDANAFEHHKRIVSVEIKDGATTIDYWAFYGCTNLTSITIPDSVTRIAYSAFEDCTGLKNVIIGSGVTRIDNSAFWGCNNLTTVIIPESVTNIDKSAFANCTSLTDVYYAGSEAEWNAIEIRDRNEDLTNATIRFNTHPTISLEMDVSPYRENGNFTAPTKGGYVFAGWYQDAKMTKLMGSNVTTGTAYAKFVDEDVLSVKWQVSSGTNANSKKTSLRVLTTVDGLTYSQVGFTVAAEGKPVKELTSKTVYRTIYGYTGGNNEAYRPQIFSPNSEYFMVHTLTGIPQSDFQKEIKVTPKWVTLDGTPVNGKPLTIRICDAEGF